MPSSNPNSRPFPKPPVEQAGALITSIARLSDPLGDIFAALDADTLLQILRRVPPKVRTQMLQSLGVPSAKLSPRAAGQCLTTLRAHKERQEPAAQVLAIPTLTALTEASDAANWLNDTLPLQTAVKDFPRNRRAELLLTAFAFPLLSLAHTVLLRLTMDRFPMATWGNEATNAVTDACTALEVAWRPIVPPMPPAAETDALSAASVVATPPPTAPSEPATTPAGYSPNWEARAAEVAGKLSQARDAAQRIRGDLEQSRSPQEHDVTALGELRSLARTLHTDLAAHSRDLAPGDPDDLAGLITAANTAHTASQAQAALKRVASLHGAADNPALDSVRARARGVTDVDTAEAAHLKLLAELVDATTRGDDDAIDEIMDQLKDAEPDVASVSRLILRGRVTAAANSPFPEQPPTPPITARVEPQPATPAPASPAAVQERQLPERTPEQSPEPTLTAPPAHEANAEAPAPPALRTDHPNPTPETSAPDQTAPEPIPADTAALISLLDADRIALAAHAAQATGHPVLGKALQLLQLTHSVRSETGPCAEAVRERVADEALGPSTSTLAGSLVLTAAALRAALLTADPNAGELIAQLTGNFPSMTHLQSLCTAIGTASARGLLTSAGGLHALDAAISANSDIKRAAKAAATHRAQPRNLQFERANAIVRKWWSDDGLIGSLLAIAADDRRDRVNDVTAAIRRLDRSALDKALKDIDRGMRHGAPALQGAARNRIVANAQESLEFINAWLLATRTQPRGLRLSAPLTELRSNVQAEAQGAATELRAQAMDPDDPRTAAIASAVERSITTTLRLLEGRTLPGDEPSPALALNGDLLRCANLPMTRDIQPERSVTLEDVVQASETSWTQAAHDQADAGNFSAATLAVEAAETESGDDDRSLREAIEQQRGRQQSTVGARLRLVAEKVATATRQGCLPEPGRSDVAAQLAAAQASLADDDIRATTGHLDQIEASLPDLAQQAKTDLLDRARSDISKATGVPGDTITRITELADSGDLATAEDYLRTALSGEEPPTANPEDDLERFFPAVPNALPQGITPDLVRAAADGMRHGVLDFSGLSERDRATTAAAMEQWATLRSDWSGRKNSKYVLRAALRLAGIEYNNEGPSSIQHPPSRRWIELLDVQLLGGARLPAFGSDARGRLNVLVSMDVSQVSKMLAWVDQDTSPVPVLLVVLGTLSAAARRELAVLCAKQPNNVLCLDAAALAYLAAQGSNRFAVTERILAPFAATNPYRPDANEAVPMEMFYGRHEELASILAPDGAHLLYGGRQLGKSALLRAAARRFEDTPGHLAVYIPLPTTLGMGVSTEELWDTVARELQRKRVPLPPLQRRISAYRRVTQAVTDWLDEAQSRRLLMLFDECDLFFEADSKEHFAQTTRLRELMSHTNRRFKPVFAGLHQVQRFSGLPNQPLAGAHFGHPLVIGPLSSVPAFRLIRQPLEALGIRLPDVLIHRILAYCNYHPKLLQLVGQALVQTALKIRSTTVVSPDSPPWHIDNETLERVIGSRELTERTAQTINLTLELDARYKLIALVVALEAHNSGVAHRITTRNLSQNCRDWWPQGLADQGPDEFRALLEELDGLGVLTGDPSGWRLQSASVLNLLGTQQVIEQALENYESSGALTKLTTEQARRPAGPDHHISPVTMQQLRGLTRRRNELRIVLGSPATGLSDIIHVLHDQADRAPSRLEQVITPTSPAKYKEQLRAGKPGIRHRVIVLNLSPLSDPRTALELAQDLQPEQNVTRTVVALADASDPKLLALAREPAFDPDNTLVPLRRATPEGVSSWIDEVIDDVEAASMFTATEARKQLMDATGGWPMLLNTALAYAQRERTASAVCKRLEQELSSSSLGTQFLQGLGLTADAGMRDLIDEFATFDEPLPWDDLVELLRESHPQAECILETLRGLDALDQYSNQRFGLNAVIRQTWLTPSTS